VTWLVWRQHRKHLFFGLAALATLAIFMVPTGISMHDEFQQRGLSECLPGLIRAEAATYDPHRLRGVTESDAVTEEAREEAHCFEQVDAFFGGHQTIILVGLLLLILPLLAGMFWGAPLIAREVENGTHRLVWTQGVSRVRWVLVKTGLLSVGVVVLSGIYAAMVAWWITPVMSTSGQRFAPIFFDEHGFVVFGYALFALALGIFAGAVTRRVLPAMATTLVGFIALRLSVLFLLRSRFMPVETRRYSFAGSVGEPVPNLLHGDWILETASFAADGQRVAECSANQCPSAAYLQDFFHPAERFVTFQAIESAIFVVVAVALIVATVYWVRQRVA
jgi:ABC-type transport system involved in multi-copper enzyme maturation permease subunit